MKLKWDFFDYLATILALIGFAVFGTLCSLSIKGIHDLKQRPAQKMEQPAKKGCPCYEK